jgi:O-acetylhomoserine/O-acetylserine sulfhydrylase-like pyridoxal-dependent enzyme
MSYSLAISNGDLVVQNGDLAKVSGAQKLYQDLMCWVLTQMGSNIYEPQLGSLINGGTQNGIHIPSPIGEVQTNWNSVEVFITSEIQRLVSLYQTLQAQIIQQSQAVYNKTILTPDQTIRGINNIQLSQNEDALTVIVDISTMAGSSVTLNIPVQQGLPI